MRCASAHRERAGVPMESPTRRMRSRCIGANHHATHTLHAYLNALLRYSVYIAHYIIDYIYDVYTMTKLYHFGYDTCTCT